jgi:hypothetical protein
MAKLEAVAKVVILGRDDSGFSRIVAVGMKRRLYEIFWK